MKICMVLRASAFPGDVRVENEALALIDAGHEVYVVCDPLEGRANTETYRKIHIIRVPPVTPSIYSKVNTLLYFLVLRNYFWQRFLRKLHHRHQFDVFHVHDLPFTGTVIDVARRLGVPVVFDNHENYPIGLQYYNLIPQTVPKQLWPDYLYSLDRWLRYEKESFERADRIIGTVPEMKKRITGLGISAEKIVVVSNTLNLAEFDAFPIKPEIIDKYRDRFVISYIGSLAQHRRLDTIVRAMPAILNQIPNALLLIVGGINSQPVLRELTDQLELKNAIDLVDWQPFETIPSYIQASSVGVLPQQPNEHTSNTIPHKLFQYMYFRKPQVVSNCTAVARIVEETGCGLVCREGVDDPVPWAAAITSLREAPTRQQMGERGRQGVINTYNWSVDKQRLVDLYDGLAVTQH
jgi:glycosyltransferase involved in cell wall biosynthesis